jgi:hypothetical protein
LPRRHEMTALQIARQTPERTVADLVPMREQ